MSEEYRVLDLFSGIGGFSLGLERSGMKTEAFCEIDAKCIEVLNKHWPKIKKYRDIKDVSFKKDEFDIICGGFPCQDISVGGKGVGIKGNRSGLWSEYKRIINEVKPRYAIIENVERLRKKGLGVVLRDLSEIGYNAEWHCITARAIGLPHQRDRLWIIAYPSSERFNECAGKKRHIQINEKWESKEIHTNRKQCELKFGEICTILSKGAIENIRNAYSCEFSALPSVRRVTNGIPEKLDENRRKIRIKQLGNSIIPQIAEMIGREIIKHDNQQRKIDE